MRASECQCRPWLRVPRVGEQRQQLAAQLVVAWPGGDTFSLIGTDSEVSQTSVRIPEDWQTISVSDSH